MTVCFDDCKRELLERGGAPARRAYDRWRRREGYEKVVAFVHETEHRHLFAVTPEHLDEVKRRSEHALGDVQSTEQLPRVEDFTCPFALQHLFHDYLERHERVPTWQEWNEWMWGPACRGFVLPLLDSLGWADASSPERGAFERATRWRLGKFYYSAVREVELLTRLRVEHGVPLKYHVLADVLLRADFWLGDVVVCTYFPNPTYRDRKAGRKPPAQRYLGQAEPPLSILHVPVERQGFGTFWSISDASLLRLADAVRSSG